MFMNLDPMHLFEILLWPIVFLIAVFGFRSPLIKILDRFSTAKELNFSIGSLSIQAKAMKEIHDSIGLGFQEQTLRKAEVEALIDTKIRSVQSAILYEMTKVDIRQDPRKITSQKIEIKNARGEVFTGDTLDVSEAGIGFKSKGRLQFNEIVQITPIEKSQANNSFFSQLMIVRIEQADEGFYYGANTVNNSSNTEVSPLP